MQCNHAQHQLNALADGELNRWQTRRLAKHLKYCSDCTAELAAIRQIGEQTRTWRAAAAPANLQTQIARTLADSKAQGSVLSLSNEENASMNPDNTSVLLPSPGTNSPLGKTAENLSIPLKRSWGRVNWRPIAALSGVGIMLAVMALFLTPTRKSFAFADVLTAMQKIRTVHWTVKSSGFTPIIDPKGDSVLTVMEAWARLDKPAYVLLVGPEGGMKMLMTPQKHTMITDGKILMELPLPPFDVAGKGKEAGLREFILAQLVSPIKDADAQVKGENTVNKLQDFPSFQKEEVLLDGQRVVRFYSNSKFGQGRFIYSLWVDPETRLIVRSETQMPNSVAGQPDITSIATQFRYNEEPPVGIFDAPAK